MHIMQPLKVIRMTMAQTPRELSILYSMISPLGELPCNGVLYTYIYIPGNGLLGQMKKIIFALLYERITLLTTFINL